MSFDHQMAVGVLHPHIAQAGSALDISSAMETCLSLSALSDWPSCHYLVLMDLPQTLTAKTYTLRFRKTVFLSPSRASARFFYYYSSPRVLFCVINIVSTGLFRLIFAQCIFAIPLIFNFKKCHYISHVPLVHTIQ